MGIAIIQTTLVPVQPSPAPAQEKPAETPKPKALQTLNRDAVSLRGAQKSARVPATSPKPEITLPGAMTGFLVGAAVGAIYMFSKTPVYGLGDAIEAGVMGAIGMTLGGAAGGAVGLCVDGAIHLFSKKKD